LADKYQHPGLTNGNDTRVISCVAFSPAPTRSSEDVVTELTNAVNTDELADLFGLPEEASWQERALCAQTDPEAFFPEKGGSTREAKRICTGCEVRGECLEYALQHDERFGIWGGLSERERRRLKRRAV
jgi:WhiB family redox-sensing transcriptional regulator